MSDQDGAMSAPTFVGLVDRFARGWPEHETGWAMRYVSLEAALTTAHDWDAHTVAYSVPSVERRLAGSNVFAELDGVPMVLLFIDSDDPAVHGTSEPARAEWWADERAKLDRLLADHPGGFAYRTRGGYRIVYRLAEPIVLCSTADAAAWKARYLAWLAHLQATYGIVGDPACQDWTRHYRLPRVRRDGQQQEHETIGDATAIGAWNVEVTIPEPAPRPAPTAPRIAPSAEHFSIRDALASAYPGARMTATSEADRYEIECPWTNEHSTKDSGRSTVVFVYPSGAWEFKCSHAHCAHRNHKDFRRWLDPSWTPFEERLPRSSRVADGRAEDEVLAEAFENSEPVPLPDDVPHAAEGAAAQDELGERRRQKRTKVGSSVEVGNSDHPGLGPNGGYRLTDLGNAKRFADSQAGRLRHVLAWEQWLTWDNRRWLRDDLGTESAAARQVVAAIYADAAACASAAATAVNAGDREFAGAPVEEMTKWARDSAKRARIESMIALARTEPEIATKRDAFDRDLWALNVTNGTIDLRTGELRPHRQSDMITKLAPVEYNPKAEAPLWKAFLERALPDEEVRGWVQRYLGYSLTGDVREQCLAFFVGGGANGKSVLLDVVLGVLGDYGLRAAPDLVLAKHGEAHPTEQADLEGRRIVVCSEIEQGRAWAESTIKRITGDTTITARRMRQDFYTFPATHKLVVAANTRPTVRGTDHGIWRRMRLVPWTVRIPAHEQDRELPHRLLATEAPGILAWLVRGCLAWQKTGLGTAKAIEAATADYRADQDVLGRWMDDSCEVGETLWDPTSRLYANYEDWCKAEGIEHPWTKRAWRERLLERDGIQDDRKAGARGLAGIALRRGA